MLFSGVTIQQHSVRQSSTSKITVTKVQVLNAAGTDFVDSIFTVKF